MVSLKIKPWDPIDGLEHVKTNWRIATDIEMTNILEEITESDVWLILWYSNITIPSGVTYYAQAQRILSDDTVLAWTNPIPIRNHNNSDSILLQEQIKIDTPIVNILENDDTLTISTGAAKLTADSHFATHWILRNAKKEVIYVNLYDETDLTVKEISKELLDFDNLAGIYAEAIHITATGVESKIGSRYIDIMDVNFEIINNLRYLEPYTDLVLKLSKIDPTLPIGVSKVVLKSMYGDEIIYTDTFSSEVSLITIPKELLLPNKEYVIELYVTNTNGVNNIARYYATTNDYSTRTQFIDNDRTYDNVLEVKSQESDLLIGIRSSLYETFDNRIYSPYIDLDGNLIDPAEYVYDKENDDIRISRSYVPGISSYDTTEGWYGRMYEGNLFVTDNINNGKTMFAVYDYNPFAGSFSLKHTLERVESEKALGRTNAVVPIDNETIAFIEPEGSSSIGFYNIKENTLSYSSEGIFSNVNSDTVLIDIGNGRLMAIVSDPDIINSYVYNINTNSWSQGIVIPEEFRGYTMRTDKLTNGNTIIYRNNKDGGYDNDRFMLYDIIKSELIVIDPQTNNVYANDTSIKLNNGDILLIANSTGEEKYKHLYK